MSADHPHDLPQTDSQPWLWWGRDKDKDKDAGKADDKAQDKPQADLSAQVTLQSIREKFGVEITPRERGYEYSYRAGGKDNVVATSTTDQSGLTQTDKALQKQVDDRLQTLSDRYKVSFGRTGDPATVEYFYKEDCSWGTGRILRAVTPTFKQLHGIEEGLKVSEPSQLDDTGKAGLKISFLDGQIMPSPYGGRPVLGLLGGDADPLDLGAGQRDGLQVAGLRDPHRGRAGIGRHLDPLDR